MSVLCKYSLWGATVVAALGLGACQQQPDRKDRVFVRPSGYAKLLPRASSIEDQYIPSKDGESPNNKAAYHVTPNLSYEDRTLDENISGAIEISDYYTALKEAGWQPWLLGNENYTVLAVSNKAMEDYVKTWPNPNWRAEENKERLKSFIGQTILRGKWDLAKIKRRARQNSGSVSVETLNGTAVKLSVSLSGGECFIQNENGQIPLTHESYPQSNGILYITDHVLPY